MKYLIFSLCLIVTLSGCSTQLQRDNKAKRALCDSFAMETQEFSLPPDNQPDVICVDRKTGEHVYFMFTRTSVNKGI